MGAAVISAQQLGAASRRVISVGGALNIASCGSPYLSILLSWANSSTFILTYGQRGPSKPSHLGIADLIKFVYKWIFRVLTTVRHIPRPHTQSHASFPHFYTALDHLGRTVTPYFAFFFMLCHTRPLSRIYVFALVSGTAARGAAIAAKRGRKSNGKVGWRAYFAYFRAQFQELPLNSLRDHDNLVFFNRSPTDATPKTIEQQVPSRPCHFDFNQIRSRDVYFFNFWESFSGKVRS